MMPAQSPGATTGMDPSAMSGDGSSDDESSGSQGTTVCITAMPDGTFSVQIQESGDDGDEGPGDNSDGPQTADSLDEALQIAGQMLTDEMNEDSGESDSGSDGDAPMSPANAKSAWNAMAAKRDKSRMS